MGVNEAVCRGSCRCSPWQPTVQEESPSGVGGDDSLRPEGTGSGPQCCDASASGNSTSLAFLDSRGPRLRSVPTARVQGWLPRPGAPCAWRAPGPPWCVWDRTRLGPAARGGGVPQQATPAGRPDSAGRTESWQLEEPVRLRAPARSAPDAPPQGPDREQPLPLTPTDTALREQRGRPGCVKY